MRICFTIDDVIRNKTAQICKIYKKYVDNKIDLSTIKIDSPNLQNALNFETKKDYNKFLYDDYSYEIFAEAGFVDKMICKEFNLWHLSICEDDDFDGNVELIVANPFEFNSSIGYTQFFLSKASLRVREYYFPLNSTKIWDRCDVLVTADPILLNSKPEGKVSIKISMDYNNDCKSDYTFDKLSDFLKSKDTLKEILNDSKN